MIDQSYESVTEIEKEISLFKKYKFSENLIVREFEKKILVINGNECNWLVLNHEEFEVFKLLQAGKSIEEVINIAGEEKSISVITQIEAKKFEKTYTFEKQKRNIYIYLTNNCNLRCKHCYMYAGDIKMDELNLENWKKIILDFKHNNGNGITFTGGEVLVYPFFNQLIKYTHDLGIEVTVLSNGVLWTPKLIEELAPCIDEIQISLDGYDNNSFKKVRGVDKFDKILSTIDIFSKTSTKVCIAVTPMFEEIDDFIEKFEQFGKKLLKDYPSVYLKISMELLDGRDINGSKINNLFYKEKMKELTEKLYPGYYKRNFVLNFKNKKKLTNCGFGEISLSSNGNIYYCNRILELTSAGNILNIGFKSAFEQSDRIKTITDVDHSKICSKCEVKYLCGGGCRLKYNNIKNVNDIDFEFENNCIQGTKERFYRQMIDSNEYFFE